MGPKPPQKGKRRGKGRRDDDEYGGYAQREQKLIKPPDQEKLTEAQLKEEIQRVLVTTDPTIIRDRVVWDFKEKYFVIVPVQDDCITLFHMESELVPKDQVEEVKKVYPYPLIDIVTEQDEKKEKKQDAQAAAAATATAASAPIAGAPSQATAEATPQGEEEPKEGQEPRTSLDGEIDLEEKKSDTKPEEEEEEKEDLREDTRQTKFLNQFDYSDRSTQTYNNPLREHASQTIPPPRSSYKDYCNAWIIYDVYEADLEAKQAASKPSQESQEETTRGESRAKATPRSGGGEEEEYFYEGEEEEEEEEAQPEEEEEEMEEEQEEQEEEEEEAEAEGEEEGDEEEGEGEDEEGEGGEAEDQEEGEPGEPKPPKAKPPPPPTVTKAERAKRRSSDGIKVRRERDTKPRVEKARVKMRKASVLEGQAAQEAALNKSAEGLKILERLVMQNIHNEVLFDFKYYEDASDEFRETGEGTILPLWKFSYDKAKRLHVTGISWSQSDPDMFAVSYGSFSFTHPITDGMLLIWSLRNPAFPEQVWVSPRGCMCCAVHPKESCLVAVGMYDGNVALLNLMPDEDNGPSTTVLKNIHTIQKHRSPIWSVKWGEDDMDGEPNFYSCGLDGRILHWRIDTSDSHGIGGLGGTEICTLHLPVPPVTGPDGTTYKLFGCARVIAFHPKEKTTFLVGTAEGNIFHCSSLYGSRFQQIYNAHFLPVAALEWNYYHNEVFISCSEDWTIKIWQQKDPEPMYIFEIGVAILDCCWAPYSSTVFAAVTEEGKALVYDLNVNKEKPICCQQIVTKKKVRPNRIQFNPFYPIICVGDDRGQLTTLKLSPNLRILPKDSRGVTVEGEQKVGFEIGKMTKLLSLVRDPESLSNPKSMARSDEKQVKIVLSAMGKQ